MIKFVRAENIDLSKWGGCILAAQNKNVFGLSWYLNAVCNHWDALILNDYEAIIPLPNKRKFGIRVLYQPFFSRLFNIYTSVELSNSIKQSFFDEIKKRYPRILLGYGFQDDFRPEGLKNELFPYQVLDLNQSYQQIASGYSKNATRLINKSNKIELATKAISPSQVVAMFRETKGSEIKELKKSSFNHLERLMTACLEKDYGRAIGAFNPEGELCATAFFIIDDLAVFYLKGATNSIGRKHGGMYFLFDAIIKQYANQPLILDFGGSSIPSVATFYKKFGAIDKEYLFLSKKLL